MSNKVLPIITKSPGKVLICGGYGALQQNNYAFTLALQSCFYCVCINFDESYEGTQIRVHSPQLQNSWKYVYNEGIKQSDGKVNAFVQNAIVWTLRYLRKQQNAGRIQLCIIFTRNYISNADALDETEFPIYKQKYTKTGLGSSACVLVSIVKTIISIFSSSHNLHQSGNQNINRIVNVISQIANLSAQKKIGSNFDISVAVYGTHLYKNILPYKLDHIIQQYSWQQFQNLIQIDPEIRRMPIPQKRMYSYIADINKGADTRVMVKGFLAELKKNTLQIQNQFYDESKKITQSLFQSLSKGDSQKCKQINNTHRKLQQKFSQITGVPVEPKDLRELIDSFCEIPDCIYAICPGSGGYDAIFILADSDIEQKLIEKAGDHHIRRVEVSFEEVGDVKQKQILKVEQFMCKYFKQ